jgi:hypothetical protein
VCDTAVLRAYLKLPNDEKCAVLADTDFTLEEADSIIRQLASL